MSDAGTTVAPPIERLFEPLQVGRIQIRNRLAFAPCTRQRSDLDGTPNDLNVEYYRQRAGAGPVMPISAAFVAEMPSSVHLHVTCPRWLFY